jgi:uncharacterized protein YndB with AHSA1/START domain
VGATDFVYRTHIETTPEQCWQALTEPAFQRRYWDGWELESDWKKGSPIVWVNGELRIADTDQVVLESDPPRRLSYTWHSFTDAWARASNIDEQTRAQLDAEPRSKVTFDIEPDDTGVKLTVTHDAITEDNLILKMVSGGWPPVIESLKSLLEGESYSAHRVVHAPRADVFRTLATLEGLRGWWTLDVTGSPDAGGDLRFGFSEHDVLFHVVRADQDVVEWQCTKHENLPEWAGTKVRFEMFDRPGGSTRLFFRHEGLAPSCDCYEQCAHGWDFFMPSIAAAAESNDGAPWGSDAFKARYQPR